MCLEDYSEHGGTVHGDTSAAPEDDDVISRDVIRQEWIMLSNRVDWICFFIMALVVALISIIILSAIKCRVAAAQWQEPIVHCVKLQGIGQALKTFLLKYTKMMFLR